jgi:hypothetical protein
MHLTAPTDVRLMFYGTGFVQPYVLHLELGVLRGRVRLPECHAGKA